MKAKVKGLAMLIIAVLVAVFTVGYAFAWFFDKKDADFELTGASAGAYFESGDGSKETPFIISNATHMRNLAVLQNTGRFGDTRYYFEIKKTLTAPLNMGGIWLPPIGSDDNPFIGDFNGNGKTIKNLKVTTDKGLLTEINYPTQAAPGYAFSQAVGLFGNTGKESNISNFILDNPHVVVGAVGVNQNKYGTDAAKAVGIAVGHVAGKCSSIGILATDAGANTSAGVGSTTLDVRVTGYSTFNSILGELGQGVESSVTGGGAGSEGTGGSGNAFGASFDVDGLLTRLKDKIYIGKYGKDYKKNANEPAIDNLLPLIDTKSDNPVPALGYKVPFTVDSAKSIYAGATAQEIAANNNVGYVMGNQNKISTKTLKFASDEPSINSMIKGSDGVYTMPDGSAPTNNSVPRWFYIQNDGWNNSHYQSGGVFGFAPISQEKYNELPANIKSLLVTESKNQRTYAVMRMQAEYNEYHTAPISTNALDAFTWGYHGQISWMGNTYGKGFADNEGYAIDESGKYYTSSGTLLGDDGYDRDADGYYGVDVFDFANFPYIVYSIEAGASHNTAYALDANGNRYLRYDPEGSGEYVYGIINGGYLMTGDGYQYYVAPVAGWTAPIPLIDANGYAMASAGVYYDVSGNILAGGYVKDGDYYVPVDSNFLLPIPQFTNGHAQDADGNYYGVITLNDGQTVYCYLGSDGTAAGYSGYYTIDGNNFLVAATNVDADGFVKYNATDYYGTYNGISGYVDANGYFYTLEGSQKVYVSTDAGFNEIIKNISSSGYAMTADGRYYGKGTVNNSTVYGLLDVSNNGKKYLQVDGKYIATDGNSYDAYDVDDDGRIMYNDELYYATLNSAATGWQNALVMADSDGYVYDFSLDAHGNPKGYYLDTSNWAVSSYRICDDENSQYYGYFVEYSLDSDGNFIPYKDAAHNNALVKAWGYTAEEIRNIDVSYAGNIAVKVSSGDFLKAVEGGEYISVAEGTKNQAISSTDINGIEGEFIALQEGEKVKVVEEGASGIANVIVKQGSKVQLYAFKSGIALPNNGLWFKPSQAGKMRFVMFAQSDSESFSLLKCTRTNATLDDPFYTDGKDDITVEKVIQQRLPVYALFYYEFEVKAEEVYNTEYVIMIDNNVQGNGAFFLYLDIGSSATEEVTDTSTIVEGKISAIDFIYEGVEIEQTDTTIGVGNFIVNTSGTKALYDSSKTSVYFENIKAVLKVVYVRLHNDDKQGHSGKTICLEYSDPKLNTDSEVKATYASYVCPTISGGSGSVSGGGGGGTVTPTPGPTPSETVTQTADISGTKSANDVLLTVQDADGNTISTATLLCGGGAKTGGSIDDGNGNTETGVAHIQTDSSPCLEFELAEGYTYTITIYAGSSGSGTRNITLNGVTQASGAGSVCKAVTWNNVAAGKYQCTANGNIRLARIVITATPN